MANVSVDNESGIEISVQSPSCVQTSEYIPSNVLVDHESEVQAPVSDRPVRSRRPPPYLQEYHVYS